MNLFLLAAGLGSRLRPITDQYPKPCVPFLNVPMGFYNFRFLDGLDVNSYVVNTHHLPEKIRALYTRNPFFAKTPQFSDEISAILGSAGGLKKAASLFESDDTILMMNANEIFFPTNPEFLKKAYKVHEDSKNLATLIVMKHPEAGKKFGGIWCSDNTVKNIGKDNTLPDLQPWHYIGIIFLNKKVLSLITQKEESNIFYDVLIHSLKTESVKIFPVDCTWYETGNPADYLEASRTVLSSLSTDMLQFISRFDLSHTVKNETGISLVSSSVKIDTAKLSGFNIISKSANPDILNKKDFISNSVIFGDQVLNFDDFT